MGMSVRFLSLVIGMIMVLGGSAWAAPGPQKWALIVGVDKYDSEQISPLRCAAADARALEAALVEVAGFPREHVVVMTSDGPASERPTAENILERIAGFASACKPGDDFVFFFSGHGIDQDGEGWLLPCNARIASTATLKKSCLGVKEIMAAIREVKATRILQLIDACRNDPRAGRGAGDNRLSSGLSRDLVLGPRESGTAEAAVTLFSCKVGQRSYEGFKDHGYFTWFLVAGLRGAAAAADGTVTVPALVNYLESHVSDAVRLHEAGKEQTPWADISGNGSMSWIISKTSKAAGGTTVGTRPPVALPTTPPRWRVDGVWQVQQASGYTFTMSLLQNGDTLSGSAVMPEALRARAGYATPMGSVTGTVNGDHILIDVTWAPKPDGSVSVGRYEGTLAVGGLRDGKCYDRTHPDNGSGAFSATGPARRQQ